MYSLNDPFFAYRPRGFFSDPWSASRDPFFNSFFLPHDYMDERRGRYPPQQERVREREECKENCSSQCSNEECAKKEQQQNQRLLRGNQREKASSSTGSNTLSKSEKKVNSDSDKQMVSNTPSTSLNRRGGRHSLISSPMDLLTSWSDFGGSLLDPFSFPSSSSLVRQVSSDIGFSLDEKDDRYVLTAHVPNFTKEIEIED